MIYTEHLTTPLKIPIKAIKGFLFKIKFSKKKISEEIKAPFPLSKTEAPIQINPLPPPLPHSIFFNQNHFFQNSWNFRQSYIPNLNFSPFMFSQGQIPPNPMYFPMPYTHGNY